MARAFVFVTGVGKAADDNIAELREDQGRSTREQRYSRCLACGTWTRSDGSFQLGSVPPGVRVRVAAVFSKHQPAQSGALVFQAGSKQTLPTLRLTSRR